MPDDFSLPSLTPPDLLSRIGTALQGKPDPQFEYEKALIERKIAESKLQTTERSANLAEIDNFNKVLKASKTFLPYVPADQRDKFAQDLADKSPIRHPIRDPAIIRGFLEKPDETSQALDVYIDTIKTGGSVMEAAARALKISQDPELNKELSKALTASLTKTGSVNDQIVRELAIDPKTGIFDAQKGKDIVKEMRTNPQGLESRAADIIIKKNQGTATPQELDALKEMKELVGSLSAQRGGGAERGRLGIRSTPQYQQTEEDIARSRAEGSTAGHPLGEAINAKVVAIQQSIQVAKELNDEFTPEERAKFAGIFKYPLNKILQLEYDDPRFAKFMIKLNRAKGAAFGEGGKQLTPFEAGVVFGYVPTGTELSPSVFEEKLNDAVLRGTQIYNALIKTSRTPRGKLQELPMPSKIKPPPGPPKAGMIPFSGQ